MNVKRLVSWSIPALCLIAMSLASKEATASPVLQQPGLVQALAPTAVGWHRWGGGWGYRGWGGGYYYGRPWIYRPYYRTAFYGGGFGYGYSTPYYSNYNIGWPYSTGYYTAYRPVVYSTPVYTTSYYQPAVYRNYGFYSGYTGYYGGAYPLYGYASYTMPYYAAYGYNSYSPYGACCGYW